MTTNHVSPLLIEGGGGFQWTLNTARGAHELIHVETGKVAAMVSGSYAAVFAPFTTNGKRSQYITDGDKAAVEAVVLSKMDGDSQ